MYRLWVVWFGRRQYFVIPGCIYLAALSKSFKRFELIPVLISSAVYGIIWLKIAIIKIHEGITTSGINIESSVFRWYPSLSFSCTIDIICTTMIAGSLIVHYIQVKKLGTNRPGLYLPVVIVFVESSALSTISKILQLGNTPSIFSDSMVFIPLCVST